jgi:hypothetical protein
VPSARGVTGAVVVDAWGVCAVLEGSVTGGAVVDGSVTTGADVVAGAVADGDVVALDTPPELEVVAPDPGFA